MNIIKRASTVTVLVIGIVIPVCSFSKDTIEQHRTNHAPETSTMTDGEIRKVDPETGKVTIRHAEIGNLGMPPMTMVFTAKDKSLLHGLKTGDKVRFAAVDVDGKLVVTAIDSSR